MLTKLKNKTANLLTITMLWTGVLTTPLLAEENTIVNQTISQSEIIEGEEFLKHLDGVFSIQKEETFEIAPGLTRNKLTGTLADDSPLVVHILNVDVKDPNIEVKPVMAGEEISETKKVSEMVVDNVAAAGVNGSFFNMGDGNSVPLGSVVIDGKLLTSSDMLRSSVGIMADDSLNIGYFSPLINLSIANREESWNISRLNRPPNYSSEITIYDKAWGEKNPLALSERYVYYLLTAQEDGYQVDEIKTIAGEVQYTYIPENGLILSVPGEENDLITLLHKGSKVNLSYDFGELWQGLKYLFTAGPLLVENGLPVLNAAAEGFTAGLLARNPRTALAETEDGQYLFVVVEGRLPGVSTGVTFEELAYLLVQLGAKNAIGLDGGGSSTLFADGEMVNTLSGSWERPVNNGFVVISYYSVYFKNKRLQFDVPPMLENDRLLVPLRGIFETLGAQVDWDAKTKEISAVRFDKKIKLQLGNRTASINGENIELDVPPKTEKGRTMVPLRFVSEALGVQVNWHPESKSVTLGDE